MREAEAEAKEAAMLPGDPTTEAALAEAYEAEVTVADIVDGLGELDAGIQREQVATNRRQAPEPQPSTERPAGTGPLPCGAVPESA